MHLFDCDHANRFEFSTNSKSGYLKRNPTGKEALLLFSKSSKEQPPGLFYLFRCFIRLRRSLSFTLRLFPYLLFRGHNSLTASSLDSATVTVVEKDTLCPLCSRRQAECCHKYHINFSDNVSVLCNLNL